MNTVFQIPPVVFFPYIFLFSPPFRQRNSLGKWNKLSKYVKVTLPQGISAICNSWSKWGFERFRYLFQVEKRAVMISQLSKDDFFLENSFIFAQFLHCSKNRYLICKLKLFLFYPVLFFKMKKKLFFILWWY